METPLDIFLGRLENKRENVIGQLNQMLEQLFDHLRAHFTLLFSSDGLTSETNTFLRSMEKQIDHADKMVHEMFSGTYEELFFDYELSLDADHLGGMEVVESVDYDAVNAEINGVDFLFENTQVKRRKVKQKLKPDDRALKLMNRPPRDSDKPYYCKWPDCGHSSKIVFNLAKHVRYSHFKLPLTKQEQEELKIIDNRDPFKFVGKIENEDDQRETVLPDDEDLRQPNYERQRKFVCKYNKCGQSFTRKQHLTVHERKHLQLKPYRCTYGECMFKSAERNSVRRHVRQKHFHLPKTLKKQDSLNILDPRDPDEYIEEDGWMLNMI